MKFAKYVFLSAGIFGILALAPMYFMEAQIGRDFPPAVTHPEFFYGFVGVALAWQVAFLLMSCDPVRYRPLMLAAVCEKFSFSLAVFALYAQGRVAALLLPFAVTDFLLGVLFCLSFWKTRGLANTAKTQ
jgi:hypothetical protein